jgi:hypothetical protein
MIDPGVVALFIPILIFMIPIIAILTAHQRKMAEIYAQQAQTHHDPEIAALRHEMQELKALIHQQAIALDNIASGRASMPPATTTVAERLSSGG